MWRSFGFPSRIIPAFAGNTDFIRALFSSYQDHPRIRGEHSPSAGTAVMMRGSSPHSRGTPEGNLRQLNIAGIIPAFAGNTFPTQQPCCLSRDHPRIRGEHCANSATKIIAKGSSPHSRGTRDIPRGRSGKYGIIPAFAGNTRCMGSGKVGTRDHPRIRGEHSSTRRERSQCVGSSPHSRGTHCALIILHDSPRIIPAFAGNTTNTDYWQPIFKDHPRIRGEHLHRRHMGEQSVGSSPHSRGTLIS